MQLFHLLSLATAAAAISIRYHDGHCYDPVSIGCENIDPGFCCWCGPNRRSVSLVAIPNEWNVRYDGYEDTNCKNSKFTVNRIANTEPCQERQGGYGSSAYFFNNRKTVRSSQECRKVDTFYAADGSKYGISHLDDGAIQYLVRGWSYMLWASADFASSIKARMGRLRPLWGNSSFL
jgi:hypothetical protein